ncbi:VanZ family protein [Luteimicrobium subarcticum]|uniref:Glycopeptide antibiotics resistance protein n=1 Tax=Luteimicrobium subarcticum TaxID=620910 RepID=A0A2M8WVR7_9MICO|nr:VanZ family protein [Luteimicrobium subarcticum]PJI95012.1 glycopeptide antibiotics resistance protein [Luteimicrobium subarcticum]
MGGWTWPAYVGVVGGLLLFVVLLVPALVFQVRRYGALDARRLLGAAAVSVYGVALAAYTLLPLPSGDVAAWCAEHGRSSAQLDPFQLFRDLGTAFGRSPFPAGLRDPLVLQLVLNVLLFVPWGVVARRYLGWGTGATVAGAFAISLAIETTQYTGIWGLVGCSYRVADVDDLITNTLGGLLGALLAPHVLRWMPQAARLHAHRGDVRPVTVWRRWLGMLLDAASYVVLGFVLDLGYRLGLVAAGSPLPAHQDGWDWLLGSAVPLVVVLVVPACAGSGASWGQRIVWLAPRWPAGARRTWTRRAVRAASGGVLWGLLSTLASLPHAAPDALRSAASAASWVLAVAAVVAVPCTRGRRGLSGVLSGVWLVDVRAQSASPSPSSTPNASS